MWRRHGTSIVLALVAIVLGAWLWIDRGSVTDSERAERPKNVISVFRRDALSRIEIDVGKEKLVLARDIDRDADAAWRIESPEAGPADANAVDKLSSTFEFATFVRKVDPKSAPTFDSPRASGSLTMGKLVVRFALGGAAPTPEGASYFRVEGEGAKVFVVSKDFSDALLAGASAYKSRTIVPYLSLDLASLDVHSKSGYLHVERTGELTFRVGVDGLRASRESLDKLWSAFAEMRADSFTSADVASPDVSITMTPKDGKPRAVIDIGGACPEHPGDVVVVRREPTKLAACAPSGILEGLSMTASDLADTRLFFAHEDEVEELTIANADGSQKIEIARKGSGWHARAPFDRDLAGDEVDAANTLATAVIRAKGTNVAASEPTDPFTLRSRVRVHGGEMPGDEVIELGECANHVVCVHRAADHARLDVTAEVARKLAPSKVALKGRDVIVPALEAKDVSSIALRCGLSQDLSRENATWKLIAPSGYAADQAGALDLVDQLAHLRADSWIAESDDGSFGIASSNCAVTLTAKSEGGARTVKLQLGREGEGGVYAIVADSAGGTSPIFIEPRAFRDALARIFVDRSALVVETAHASSIVLSRGATRVELRRVADRLTAPDAGLAVSAESIASALDALRADDVVRLGPPARDEGFDAPFDVRVELEGDGGKRTVHVRFGRDVLRKNQAMVYARIDGVDATFAVARERVDPIRNAL
jgi:hypothetical protein